MIDGLKPYPEYKESGQPWLGVVPNRWEVLPNRAIFEEVKERGHPDEEMLSVTIKRGVIRQKELLADSSKKDGSNQNKSAYKIVCPNDIAYNKMRAWQGAVGVSNFRGIVSPAYVIMRLREINNPRYFHHLFRTPLFSKEAERWSYGITSDMWSLRPEHFKMIYTPLPPTDEQAAIVKFLDHATRRLNRAIRAKQKVIALLNEQKQVIIHRAVTRGLDPDVSLKPSGILWLGDIPTNWATIQLARGLTKIEQGWSPVASNDEDTEDRWAVITLSAVKGGIFDPKCRKPLPRSLNPEPRFEIRQGDFLLTRANTRTLVGDVAVVGDCRRKLMLCDLVYRIGLKKEMIFPNFLMMVLLSKIGRIQIEGDARGSSETMVKISHPHIRSWCIPLPPIEEQRSIFMGIESLIQPIHFAISCYNHEISLLQEFRTRLIADVVTGKLDVREATRRIPGETEPNDFSVENGEFVNGYDTFDSPCLTERKELDEIDSNLLEYAKGANQ